MKSMTKMISLVRTMCVTAIVSLLTQSVWAATQVAVWDGDFKITTKGGLTLNANGNAVASNGSSITISAANGVTIDGFASGTSAFSVLIKYHNLNTAAETTQAIITAKNSQGANRVGVSLLANNSGLVGTSQADGWEWNKNTNKGSGLATSGVLVFKHSSAGGTYVQIPGMTGDAYGASGLRYSGHNYDGVTIGGLRTVTDLAAATGMVIDGIAIYSGAMTTQEVNDFKWPSTDVSNRKYAPFLTETWTSTGWKVNSINELLRSTFAAKMSGTSISNKPVDAEGFHIRKVDADTIAVEFQVVNGETKCVRALFKVIDGRVCVKADKAAWKEKGTTLGTRFFNNDGTNTGSTNDSTIATDDGSAAYGIKEMVVSPAYRVNNGPIHNNQASYGSSYTYTLNLPVCVGTPVGTIVTVKEINLGTLNDKPAEIAAKLQIYDGENVVGTSSSRSNFAADATIGNNCGWFRYAFADGVDLQVGKDYTLKYLNANDEVMSTVRSRVTNAEDPDGLNAISISGVAFKAIAEIVGTVKTSSATIFTVDFTKDYGKGATKWWSDVCSDIGVKKGGDSASWTSGSDVLLNANGDNAFSAASGQTYAKTFVNGSVGDTFTFTGGGHHITYGYFAIPTTLGNSSDISDVHADSAPITLMANSDNLTPKDSMKTAIRTKSLDVTLTATDSHKTTLDYGNQTTPLMSHLTYDGGSHVLKWLGNTQTYNFSTIGSVENPSVYVKGGTLDFTMKDLNGWNGARIDTSVIKVGNGATLNFLPNSNSTMFMSGRLVLEPGSTTTYKTGTGSNGFCVYGGINVDKAQIYVPAPTGDATVATLSKATGSSKNFTFGKASGTGGAAITVEDGATLEMNTPIEGDQNFTKGGAGTLKLMQAVTASGYTGTATIDDGTIEFAAGVNSMKIATGMKGLLQVDADATYTAQAGDVPAYGTAGSVAVYGTLNMSNYRWTMGTANKTYVYAGGLIEGTGDGNGSILDFYQNGATIYGKKFNGATEQVGEISGPINLQQDVTFDVEEGMTLKISGQKRLPNQKSFTKTGAGTLELSGEWQGGTGNFYNLTISAGTIAYNLGEGNERSLCINNFSNSGTVKVLSGTLYREVAARDLSSLNLGTIECAEGAKFELRAKMTPAECTTKTVTFTGVPEGVTLKLMAGNELVTLERGEDGTATYTSDDVIIDGTACLYDFVFDNTVSTTKGSINKATLNIDGGVTVSYVDGGITAQSRPWMNINFENLDKFTVGVVATMPTSKKTTVVFLGDSVHSGNFGLHLATGSEENQVEINYVTVSEVKNITTMKVPNASTARHVYTISKVEARKFVIYLDGVQWKTVATDYDIVVKGGGIQIGSDHGGRLKDNGIYSAATTAGGGIFNVLRIYDRLLTKEEQQAYASAFPYTDPNGTSSRTLTAATEDWALTETTPWSYKASASADPVAQATATANGAIDLTVNSEENAVKAEINLDADVSYTSFTIRGNKPVTFEKAEGKTGKISATAAVTIGGDVKIVHGALDISGSPVTMGDGAKLDFDCSDIDISGIFETTYIGLTGDMEENSGVTVSALPTAANRTAELVYNAGQYAIKVTVDTVELDVPVVGHTTATATINGTAATITEDGKITVPCNANLVITYAAETGYHLGSMTQITANDVTSETTLSAEGIEATINTYTVTITAVENATAKYNDEAVEGSISVNHGTDVTITYVANTNYKLVDAEGETVDGTCALGEVTGDVSTAPAFTAVLDVTTITIPTVENMTAAVVDGNGQAITISESNTITVTIGSTFVVTYTPVEGYAGEPISTTYTNASAETQVVAPAAPAIGVVLVGTTLYGSLQDAVAAAETGATIMMTANEDVKATVVVDKSITIDLNGKTLSNTTDIWGDDTWSMISVRGEDVAVTITGNGAIQTKIDDEYAMDVQSGASLTIENGTFVGNVHAVYVYAGALTVNGGTFSVQQKFSAAYPDEYVLNCFDANYKNGTATISVTGGSFAGFNPSNCRAEGAGTNFVADGYESVKGNDDCYYVQVKPETPVIPEVTTTETTITPVVPQGGSVEVITPDGTTLTGSDAVISTAYVDTAALFTVITTTAEGVKTVANVGVINAKAEAANKVITAVAVPFTGATVANLLNTALLTKGDVLMAWVDGAYATWMLDDDKQWVGQDVVNGAKAKPATTPLKRGSAVWVETADQIVVLGKYDEKTEIVEPTTPETHILANPTMKPYTPSVKAGDKQDQVIEIGTAKPTRFTKKNGKWTAPVFVEHDELFGDVYEEQVVEPKIPVGKGFWFIKK